MKKLKPKKKSGSGESEKAVEEKGNGALASAPAPKEPKSIPKKSPAAENAPDGLVAGWTKKLQWVDQIKTFFREVRMELKKVTWPTRKETLAATAMVIILSVIVAFFLGILDVALAKLVGTIMGR
jgi:preprotein translocase subunit SecE